MKYLPVLAILANSVIAKDPITQAVYNRIIYYAELSSAAFLGDPCSTPPYGIAVQQQIDTGHNPGETGVEATIFRNDTTKEFILAFAATNNTVDFLEDLDATLQPINGNFPCSTCQVHTGFQLAYGKSSQSGSAAQLVRAALTTAFSHYPNYNLTIAGASLGGALASLSYAELVQTYKSKIIAVYTYGEPRVGNVAYANYIDLNSGATDTANKPGLYYRVTHANDVVPKVPAPGPDGPNQYRHSRTEYWESLDNGDSNTNATTYRCHGQEDPNCNYGTFGGSVPAHMDYAGFHAVSCGWFGRLSTDLQAH